VVASVIDDLQRHVAAEQELSQALANYAGQWVAVEHHHVVVAGPSVEDVLEQVAERPVEGIFRVPPEYSGTSLL
jgi:hypothetical protein